MRIRAVWEAGVDFRFSLTLEGRNLACDNCRSRPPGSELFVVPPDTGGRRAGLEQSGVVCMKVVPLGDKVAVRRLEAEETTGGGIVLPDTAREQMLQGRVLSVGDGRLLPDGRRAPHQVNEGDRVLLGRYTGTEVIVDNEPLLIMNEDEILAVLD
jgi:chaperonin GroES